MFVRRFAIRMAALAVSCAILGVLFYIAQIVLNVPTESKRRVQHRTTEYLEPHPYVGWAHVPSVRAEV
ncbi:MAG: hypothetical protein O7F12_06835, partial [Nitrospirae bacterium]|nr:hypothetical protein [Nitrospirota bacterium]